MRVLLASEVPASDPAVKRAEKYLTGIKIKGGTWQDGQVNRSPALRMTHAHSLLVMALTRLDPVKHRRELLVREGLHLLLLTLGDGFERAHGQGEWTRIRGERHPASDPARGAGEARARRRRTGSRPGWTKSPTRKRPDG